MVRVGPGGRLVRAVAEVVALSSGGPGVVGAPGGGLSSGVQEAQAAVAVQLEQVVDCALQAPLRAGGLFAA